MTRTHQLVQLSDLHLVPEGRLLRGVDPWAALVRALADVEAAGVRPDALLLTGDLVHEGGDAVYARLRALVEPVAQRLGVPVLYVVGNHDDPAAFRRVLLDDADAALDAVHDVDGLRVVVLDSTVPGRLDGALSPAQLAWLAGVLTEPAPHGTLLALHHPPLPGTSALLEQLGLAARDRQALGDVLAGSDVRLVVSGHYHQAVAGALRGVPVWVAGALADTSDALPPDGTHRGFALASYARLQLTPEAALAVAQPVPTGPLLYTQPV